MLLATTLGKARRLMADEVLRSCTCDIYSVGPRQVVDYKEQDTLVLKAQNIPGLIQRVSVESPADGQMTWMWSIKVPWNITIAVGDHIIITASPLEPSLVGKEVQVDTVSSQAWAMLTKCTALDIHTTDSQARP